MRALFRVKRLREIPHGWILAFGALSTLLFPPDMQYARAILCCACVCLSACAARPREIVVRARKHAHNQRRYKHLWAPCHAHASRSASVGVPPVRVVIAGAVVVLSPAGAIISRSQQPLHPASPPHRRPLRLSASRQDAQRRPPSPSPTLISHLSSPVSHLSHRSYGRRPW